MTYALELHIIEEICVYGRFVVFPLLFCSVEVLNSPCTLYSMHVDYNYEADNLIYLLS